MKLHYQKTREFYRRRALERNGVYDPPGSYSAWAQNRIKKIAFDLMWDEKVKPGSFILDAGCALGRFSRVLATRYPESKILGIDFSREMLTLAKQKNRDIKNLQFKKADLLSLDFPDRKFQITFCLDTLHHILPADLGRALKNISRVTSDVLILEIKNRGLAKRITNYFGGLRSIKIYETDRSEVAGILGRYHYQLVKEVPVMGVRLFSPLSVLKFRRHTQIRIRPIGRDLASGGNYTNYTKYSG